LNDHEKAQRQLQQLLALDLSGMGYEARIRHQQRIETLKAECDREAESRELNTPAVEPTGTISP